MLEILVKKFNTKSGNDSGIGKELKILAKSLFTYFLQIYILSTVSQNFLDKNQKNFVYFLTKYFFVIFFLKSA